MAFKIYLSSNPDLAIIFAVLPWASYLPSLTLREKGIKIHAWKVMASIKNMAGVGGRRDSTRPLAGGIGTQTHVPELQMGTVH